MYVAVKCYFAKKERKDSGFTLAELLIVVAIIAVLVAISIPVFSAQMHKAKVATDVANVRAYYAEIQADFISTGKYNSNVPLVDNDAVYVRRELDFLDGQKISLKEGYYNIRMPDPNKGYQISYYVTIALPIGTNIVKHVSMCLALNIYLLFYPSSLQHSVTVCYVKYIRY